MSTLEIQKYPLTDWEQNTRLLIDSASKETVIVDPAGESKKLIKVIEDQGLKPIAIWLTHSHLDHCGGVADLKSRYEVPLYAHEVEKEFRAHVENLLAHYGVASGLMKNCPEPEFYIAETQVLKLKDHEFEVFFTPGHSPGHVVFYNKAHKVLVCGDTVFKESIGRTDLPGGSHKELISSIRNKIMVLPTDTKLLPGHGDDTTLETELRSNPFLA